MQATYHELVKKYDVPTPRYTSYPTVPFWAEEQLNETIWKKKIQQAFEKNLDEPISLYLHLPFCESLCTYCACNKRITKNHQVESPYIKALLQEWQLYRNLLKVKPTVSELHLGGGTPTFFSPENLNFLLENLFTSVNISPQREFSVEVHPNTTTKEHLQVLYDWGFRRLSVGVQDFDPKVQFIINRHQTFEQTQYIIETARKIGYTSVNIDIIYGLPLQTKESVSNTIEKIQILNPDRIAFYSYAHVPWKSAAQRRYTEEDLPKAEEKRALYELGKNALVGMGYEEIGFDHFALAADGLALAAKRGTLHRNFMGYTEQNTNILIGLGCSSISDLGCSFGQNVREVEEYQEIVGKGHFPIQKGHLLTAEDRIIQQHILNLMCNGQTSWYSEEFFTPFLAQSLTLLKELEADGLVNLMHNSIKVTPLGKKFLRNICVCLDARLQNKNQQLQASNAQKMFSQSA